MKQFYITTNDYEFFEGNFDSETEAYNWLVDYCSHNGLDIEDFYIFEDLGV